MVKIFKKIDNTFSSFIYILIKKMKNNIFNYSIYIGDLGLGPIPNPNLCVSIFKKYGTDITII
jgi:hypothetical protein